MKRLTAILFVQFYLVSVFGFTLSQNICCDNFIAGDVETMAACHETPPALEINLPECSLCDSGQQIPENNDCCPDCETVSISIAESKNNESQYSIPGVNSGPKNPELLSCILLPWMTPTIPDTSLFRRMPEPEHSFAASKADVPIFIRDCTYRI